MADGHRFADILTKIADSGLDIGVSYGGAQSPSKSEEETGDWRLKETIMRSDQPGIVWMREHAGDEEVQQNILKLAPEAVTVTADFPNRLVPSGLPAERQCYLYEEMVPYCNNAGTACQNYSTSALLI